MNFDAALKKNILTKKSVGFKCAHKHFPNSPSWLKGMRRHRAPYNLQIHSISDYIYT